MRSQICLIRHGITEGNVRRLYYGKTDVPLAQKGVDELKKLTGNKLYPDSRRSKIFTTGMTRTDQTRRLIYGDRPYQVIEDLQEINFGEFEMKSYEQLQENVEYRDWINAVDMDKAPPGGESINEFNERVIRGYEEMRRMHREMTIAAGEQDPENDDEDCPLSVVICHGGTISVIMTHIWPDVLDNVYAWIPDPGHGYLLELDDDEITGYEEF